MGRRVGRRMLRVGMFARTFASREHQGGNKTDRQQPGELFGLVFHVISSVCGGERFEPQTSCARLIRWFSPGCETARRKLFRRQSDPPPSLAFSYSRVVAPVNAIRAGHRRLTEVNLEIGERRCLAGWIGCRRNSQGRIRRGGMPSAATARSDFIGLIRVASARGSRLRVPVKVDGRCRVQPDCTWILHSEFAVNDSELADAPMPFNSSTVYSAELSPFPFTRQQVPPA